MLQIPEGQLSRSFTVRAAEKLTWFIAKCIDWFADVPLLLLLVYFDAGVVGGAFWVVASQLLKSFSSFIAKASTMAGLIAVINALANYPLLLVLLYFFDSLVGGVIWVIACVVLNYYVLIWYKRSGEDWFGAEWLRAKEDVAAGWLGGLFKYFLHGGRFLAFLALSVFVDPIYGFINRPGRRQTGSGFTVEEWGWFALSQIGILPWLFLGVTAYEFIQYMWWWK